MNERGRRRRLQGVVVSDKMDKTIVVRVTRRIKHPLYKKYVLKWSKYKAHDEKNSCAIGDEVIIQESRPYSKQKRWSVMQITKRALV